MNMAILGYLMCVSFYLLKSSHGQTVTLSVTPPSPVVGQEVTLTCTVSQDITTSTSVFYTRNTVYVVEFTVTSTSCTPVQTQGGQNYTVTCGALPVRQMSLTIPAAHVTEDESGTYWACVLFLGAASNTVQLTIMVPVSTVTMTTDGAYRPSVTIPAGNSRTFTCTTAASRPVARLSWFRGVNNVTDQAGTTTDQGIGDKFTRQQSLTITGAVNVVDSGLRCEAVNIEGRTPVSSQTSNVIVQWEPQTDPSLTRDPPTTTLTEGVSVTLTCRQTGGKPLATLTWSGVCSGTTPTDSIDTTTVTSSVQFSVDRTYNGQTCTCESRHPANSYLESLSEMFVVLYQPYITVASVPPSPVIEGRQLTLTCDVDSNPDSVGAWSGPGSQPSPGATQSDGVMVITSVIRHDDGVYRCTATNSQKTNRMDLSITVHYPPDQMTITYNNITFDDDNANRQLRCAPDGNPQSFTFSKWQHMSVYGQLIRELDGVAIGQESVLTIPDSGLDTSYQDTGYYVCRVQNGVPGGNDQLVFSRRVFFNVKAPPIYVLTTQVFPGQKEKPIIISIPFYSTSGYSKVELFRNQLAVGNRFVLNTAPTNVSLTFHGTAITVSGFTTVISVQTLQQGDFGNYTLKVTNDVGIQQFGFFLKAAGNNVPTPPNTAMFSAGLAMLCIGVIAVLLAIGIIGIWFKRKDTYLGRGTGKVTEPPVHLANMDASGGFPSGDDRTLYEQLDSDGRVQPSVYERIGVPSDGNDASADRQADSSAYETLHGRSQPDAYEQLGTADNEPHSSNDYINTTITKY